MLCAVMCVVFVVVVRAVCARCKHGNTRRGPAVVSVVFKDIKGAYTNQDASFATTSCSTSNVHVTATAQYPPKNYFTTKKLFERTQPSF